MEWVDRAAPRSRARLTGVVYLLYFLTAVASALIPPGIGGPNGLPSNADSFANSITSNPSSYEIATAVGLISTLLYVALAVLFYELFRPVSRTMALLMMVFSLAGSVITAAGTVLQLAPLAVLDGSSYLNALDAKQLHAIALLLLHVSAQSGAVALAFFGVFQLLLGYLIYRAGFIPALIGVLIAVAGVGWLTFLYPPLSTFLLTELEVLGFVAELVLMLWLLIRGVDDRRWAERAATSTRARP